ncbi:hypothetical protein PFISCL1PPCAC_19995 [Pristionchus fissidentatus]|uniref:Uncharacterized protein n=1 Tax=Pristionchus fissidentatus TaxID=1538716 RepID=A0AAV5WAY9_9BILA|nr:hypothetical protein PFISCL1PPCAC_19995 [Pristionchus fissidentatus]
MERERRGMGEGVISQLNLSMCRLVSLLLLLFPISLSLPECTPYDACRARLKTFETEEGSGYDPGSGESPPLYDDLLPVAFIDYDKEVASAEYELCQCADNSTCSIDDIDKRITLDNMVSLAFCKPVAQRQACTSSRGLIRVVGETQVGHSDTPVSISKALLFCTCPSGYKRLPVSTWESALLSFPYKCL